MCRRNYAVFPVPLSLSSKDDTALVPVFRAFAFLDIIYEPERHESHECELM